VCQEDMSNLQAMGQNNAVLCHHSPRQYSSHSGKIHISNANLPYICAPPRQTLEILCFGPHTSIHLLPANLLRPSWSTHGSHPRLIHIGPHLSSCASKGVACPRFLHFLKEAMEWNQKNRQWRFSWRQVHSETIGVPLAGIVFKTQLSSRFNDILLDASVRGQEKRYI